MHELRRQEQGKAEKGDLLNVSHQEEECIKKSSDPPFRSVFGVLTGLGGGQGVVPAITYPSDSTLSPFLQGA